MKLLDRFRSQPEWRSDDPAVRTSAVRALAHTEQDLLLEIARQDDAPGVRRAAIERLTDASLIAELLANHAETDPEVRATAVATARDLLIGAADAAGADAVLAVLPVERDVAAVARLAVSAAVSERAVVRLTDAKALGGVARRARHAEVAQQALARLTDRDELLAVVLKAEDKAIALAAFDRLAVDGSALPAEALADIVRRAVHKAVVRRARSELVAREASPPDNEAADPATALSLCEVAEALASTADLDAGRRAIEALVQQWAALDAPAAAAVATRFTAARRAAEDRLLELDRATSSAREEVARRVVAVAPYVALCERVEQSSGPLALDQLQAARDEWNALSPAADDEDDGRAAEIEALTRRFAEAGEACQRRHRSWAARREHLKQIETLTTELEALASAGDVAAIQVRWPALDERWRSEVARLGTDRGADDSEVGEAVAAVTARRAAAEEAKRAVEARGHAAEDRRLRERLTRLERLVTTIEAEVVNDKLQLADAERHLRRTRQALDEMGPLLAGADRSAVGRRLHNGQTALLGRVRELRDFADWQRWANLGVQEELCREMEALGAGVEPVPDGTEHTAEVDPAELARKFRDLIDRWREVADVPKDRGDDLWRRFKAAHDVVFPRCEAYFEAQRTARAGNLDTLKALADEAERLTDSTDWIKTAQRLTTLQAEWKAIGSVPRREQRALWKRFHSACSNFFTRRKADLAERKKVWASNLEQKEALCVRVEALAEATDIVAAIEEVTRTQREWRTIGAVRRSKSDALWQRFREACEAVVDRSREGDRAVAAERIAAREALCAEIEALLPAEAASVEAAPAEAAPAEAAPVEAAPAEAASAEAASAEAASAEAAPAEAAPAEATPAEAAPAEAAPPDAAEPAATEPAAAVESTAIADTKPDATADVMVEAAPDTVSEAAPDATPEAAPETVSEAAPDTTPEPAPDTAQEPGPDKADGAPATSPAPAASLLEPAALIEVVREIQGRWRQAPEVPPDDRRRLSARFGRAVARLVEARPEAFRDTDLDPARQLHQLQRLCERAEALVADEPEGGGAASPAELLARRWREQLASNTMGIRADEGVRRRAAIEEIKRLQLERRRLGSVPGDAARQLGARFQRACDRALERSRPAAN